MRSSILDPKTHRYLANQALKNGQRIWPKEKPGRNARLESLEEALGGQHFSSVEEHFSRYDRWRYGCVVDDLMGTKPEARFRFIQDRAAFAENLDI
ncbi:hypothetical protein [Rhizobium leguminosarum]|uniref:hypothetical protein n=1 Tax=Rhizobium leguminosarum TaxID=384 RepID=UPI0014413837|nr:hypothetical protein [Rhizobium leguminosarum]MBY5863196.1 hypothetical protein [Rhizobium leguminosarum]NKM04076.1 hypothetical protein [Rhizobium leguminosarum bv. viciae]